MKRFTITILKNERDTFLSEISFCKVNEFSVKNSGDDHVDVSFQCESITLYYIGCKFQCDLNEQKPTKQ